MATVTSALANVLREEISDGIREQRIKLDPAWTDVFSTKMGVKRDDMGRGWQFKQSFVAGGAGAFEFTGTIAGATIAQGDAYQYLNNAPQGFPGRTESVLPGFFLSTVTLKEGRGNVFVPLKWHSLDNIDAAVGGVLAKVTTGVSRKVARSYACAFYTTSLTNFPIVSNIPVGTNAAYMDVTIDNGDANAAHGRIQMLENGMTCDIHEAGHKLLGTAADGAVACGAFVLQRVNYINNTFRITNLAGTTCDFDCTEAENTAPMYITIRGSRGNQPSGLNTWMATSGTVFGIDFAAHPEFWSLLDATQTGALTEATLRNKIGLFIDRLGGMVDVDTILTPAGVVHAYMENEDNIMTIERNGRLLDIKAGWADMQFSYHGKPFRWAISTFIESGSVYVIKTADGNIKEYLPPANPRMGHSGEFGDVEFINPAGGLNGIWSIEPLVAAESSSPHGQVGGPGDNLNAPFWRISELCPEQMQGIKLTTFDES